MAGSKRPPKRKRGRPRGATKRNYTAPLRRMQRLVRAGMSARKAADAVAREFQIPSHTLRKQFAQHGAEELPLVPVVPPPTTVQAAPIAPPISGDQALLQKIRREIRKAKEEEERRLRLDLRARGLV